MSLVKPLSFWINQQLRMQLKTYEVQNILVLAGIKDSVVFQTFRLADRIWETCSEQFCHENWHRWVDSLPEELTEYRDGLKCPVWLPDVFDCDNHSIGTIQHAQIGNAKKAVQTGNRGGLLYGILFYEAASQNITGPHSINWLIDHDHLLKFFEPYNNRIIELTEEERQSVWFGLAA